MKLKKIQFLTAMVGMSFLWISCQKDVSDQATENPENQSIKNFGAVADDPDEVRKVQLIMSSEFASRGYDLSGSLMANGKGKPVKPGSGGSTSDATLPTVTITSPANGSTVSGTVTIQVSASDNVGVASVSVSVNGGIIGTKTTAPYTFYWNSGSVADGNHTITATAKDAAGNSKSTSITVAKNTVIVVTPPPTTIPSAFHIPMPAVGYQGSEGSCVTFAAVYYQRSAEQYKKAGSTSYSNASNVFSPEYVYNQTKASTSCGSGSSLIETLNFLYNKGVTTWQTLPYSDQNGCTFTPTSTQVAEAANYKIKSYSRVLSSDQTAIKSLLSTGHPLVFTFTADANFYNARAGYIYNSYSSTLYGPHAITLCGYDDSKKAFKAVNQWGTGWGDGGYIWIDYNFLTSLTSGLYTVSL